MKAARASLIARLCHPQLTQLHLDPLLSTELKSYPQKTRGIGNFSFFLGQLGTATSAAGRAHKVNLSVVNDSGCNKDGSPAASQA